MGIVVSYGQIVVLPTIRLDSVKAVRDRLLLINSAVALAIGTLDRADIYGDDTALTGVRDIIMATARLL